MEVYVQQEQIQEVKIVILKHVVVVQQQHGMHGVAGEHVQNHVEPELNQEQEQEQNIQHMMEVIVEVIHNQKVKIVTHKDVVVVHILHMVHGVAGVHAQKLYVEKELKQEVEQ